MRSSLTVGDNYRLERVSQGLNAQLHQMAYQPVLATNRDDPSPQHRAIQVQAMLPSVSDAWHTEQFALWRTSS